MSGSTVLPVVPLRLFPIPARSGGSCYSQAAGQLLSQRPLQHAVWAEQLLPSARALPGCWWVGSSSTSGWPKAGLGYKVTL